MFRLFYIKSPSFGGPQTSKTVDGVEKKFYYNGMYILNEGDGAEITATNFVGLTGIEGRQNGADEMAYFMKDAHGDVIKAMDSGDFRVDYEYDIWGNQMQESANTFDNPFRYCSEYVDEESGLIYLRARYYDPYTGRFTQEDPARDGLNWYAYAGNNPVIFFDPEGLDAKDEKVLLRYIIEKNGGRCEYNEGTGEVELYCNGRNAILGKNTEQIVGRTVVTVGWIMDTFGLNEYQASHQPHERFNTELEAVIASGYKIQRLSL